MPTMDAPALRRFLAERFPQALAMNVAIEEVAMSGVRVRMPVGPGHLRPGGTISGPVMMALADLAMYLLVLSRIGPVELAVTTNLNINFMRRPSGADLLAEARMLKLGKRLAMGEISIRSVDHPDLVAHATATYSIPPGEESNT